MAVHKDSTDVANGRFFVMNENEEWKQSGLRN